TEYALKAKLEIATRQIQSYIDAQEDSKVLEAIDNLIADLNDHPDLPEALFVIGRRYFWKALQRECEIEIPVDEVKYYYLNAMRVWERIIQKLSTCSTTPKAYLSAAECYNKLGEYEKAIQYYEKIINDWPNFEYVRAANRLRTWCDRKLERSKQVVILPDKLKFMNIKKGEKRKQTFSLREGSQCDLGNIRVVSSNPAIIPVLIDTQLYIDHKNYLIEVTVNSNLLKKGESYDEFVKVETEHPEFKHIDIPVHIEVMPPIKIMPSLIAWGTPKLGETLSYTVCLSSSYEDELEVMKIASPGDIEIAIKEIDKGLELVLSKEFNTIGRYEKEIKVIFAKPSGVEITIPMYGLCVGK
ncbi:MAG: tetratricopeptide repeat protein, partial [Candidatus Baldrarchaeia archaeon]